MRILATILFGAFLGGCLGSAVCGAEEAPDDVRLLQGYLPKEDLGVLDFLAAHPESDGRGIVVAILDTGVDLDHEALRETSTGEPKIIDVFDGTDNGFLPLPVQIKKGAGPLRGLSGRMLDLPQDVEEGAAVRLGILCGRDYFPDGLISRREEERRALWERTRQAWEATAAGDQDSRAEAIRDAFDRILEEDDDPGDRFDVLALPRGAGWEIRIDTDADGDLAEEVALHPYREAREVARFPDPAHFAVALERIAPDASSIFLYFDEGGHGTHVAGIVGGCYGPDHPLNGLAPGVQFLAAKVGNGRFGGSTSHNSIMKSAQWAVDRGADIINLSFGGSSFFDDGNEVTSSFFDELVERTGVIICSSAGNSGPALSTVGSPGGARRIFGWGAAISMKTQQTNYGALDPRREDLFHFTSRGPMLNGDPGVDFISPGAALSPLPAWGLVKGESWNGTSMASPQGAGFCALLLSACRQNGVPVTDARLRRAMRESARRLPGIPVIEQGDGIPQALPALEALQLLASAYPCRVVPARIPHDLDAEEPVVRWRVTVRNATGNGQGYYQRNLRERHPFRVDFRVQPDFPIDSLQADRAGFLRIVRLTSEAPWLRAPLQESLHSGGATIAVQVDPSKLEPGLNVGRIVARDVAHPGAGIEFALVATVIRPIDTDPLRPVLEGEWELESGDRRSVYVRVPEGATLARLGLREALAEPANAYVIALSAPDLVRPPGERNRTRYLSLAAGQEEQIELGVHAGTVLEAVAFSRWQDNRPGRLAWRIEFAGVDFAAEPPPLIETDRPGVGFLLGAPSWGADLRFAASLDRSEEPLDVGWKVQSDTLFPELLNGLPAMLQQGTAFVSARDGEKVEIDLRVGPEFEDMLDDSFFRAYDNSGREVAAGYLYQGICRFEAPQRGTYRVVFSVWARGTRFFDESTVVSPIVLRATGPHDLKVCADPVAGFQAVTEPLSRVELVAGERRRFFLRAEDLPEGELLRGELRIEDADGSALGRLPVRADTRAAVPAPVNRQLTALVETALHKARSLAARDDVPEAMRAEVLAELSLCERLRIASPQPPEMEEKGKRKKDRDEEELPADELWDLREARARLLLVADVDELEDAVERLGESLPEPQPEEPRTVSDRRDKEAALEELRAALFVRRGDLRKAREHLDFARGLNPDLREAKRLEPFVLFGEEDYTEARERAQRWMEGHPDDRAVDALLVRALLHLGWWDLAGLRLAGWPRLHPEAAMELLGLWEEVEKVRAASTLATEVLFLAGALDGGSGQR